MAAEKTDKRKNALMPGLYIAATPIGNLADASHRLIETLKTADLILCEDTRVTAKLCQAFGVETRRAPYHDHNAAQVRPDIVQKLVQGESICLVSDAGTPLISDPGYKLVAACREAGIEVFTVPGPCAAIAALSIAGLPSHDFYFAGFPPAKTGARISAFQKVAEWPTTLVYYESPQRLALCLSDMHAVFGDRKACIARELTKRFEQTYTGTLAELVDHFNGPDIAAPKGEIVILIAPPECERANVTPEEIDGFLEKALEHMSVRDAAAAASDTFNTPKRDLYTRALAIKKTGKE